MRRFVICAILLFGAVLPLTGQTIGLRGGLSFSQLAVDDEGPFDREWKSGFAASLDVTFQPSDLLAFRLGAGWAQKGGIFTGNVTTFDFVNVTTEAVKVDFSLDYLPASVLARIGPRVGDGRQFGWGLLVGPYAGVRVGCGVAIEVQNTTVSGPCEDTDADFKSTDFGFGLGAGIEFTTGGAFGTNIEVVYNLGLSEIADDTRTRQFVIQVGVTSLPD